MEELSGLRKVRQDLFRIGNGLCAIPIADVDRSLLTGGLALGVLCRSFRMVGLWGPGFWALCTLVLRL